MFEVNNGCFYKDCNKTFDENVFKEWLIHRSVYIVGRVEISLRHTLRIAFPYRCSFKKSPCIRYKSNVRNCRSNASLLHHTQERVIQFSFFVSKPSACLFRIFIDHIEYKNWMLGRNYRLAMLKKPSTVYSSFCIKKIFVCYSYYILHIVTLNSVFQASTLIQYYQESLSTWPAWYTYKFFRTITHKSAEFHLFST